MINMEKLGVLVLVIILTVHLIFSQKVVEVPKEEEKPKRILFFIITDGLENASKEYVNTKLIAKTKANIFINSLIHLLSSIASSLSFLFPFPFPSARDSPLQSHGTSRSSHLAKRVQHYDHPPVPSPTRIPLIGNRKEEVDHSLAHMGHGRQDDDLAVDRDRRRVALLGFDLGPRCVDVDEAFRHQRISTAVEAVEAAPRP
jgi:hypothetical protein